MLPGRTRLCNVAAAALLLVAASNWMPAPAAAQPMRACETLPGRLLQSLSIGVAGSQRLTRTIDLPAGTSTLVTAAESGVDVRIEVPAGAGTLALASDNPVRRWVFCHLLVNLAQNRTHFFCDGPHYH